MQITKFMKKCDLFSRPFTFFIDKTSKKKKTFFGGVLSILIIACSIGYLTYLLLLYFSNRFLPKISSQKYNESELQTLTLNEDLFAYQVYAQGKTLNEVEQETGKKYLSYYLRHSSYTASDSIFIEIPQKQCGNNSVYSGYTCMDFDNISIEQKTLRQFPNQVEIGSLELIISQCKGLSNCATNSEFQNVIMRKDTILMIKVSVKQYNQTSKQFQTNFRQDYFQFDEDLAVISNFSLSKSFTAVDKGLIFQVTETTEHVVDYKRVDRYFSRNNMLKKLGFEGYFMMSFELDQFYQIYQIQFPLITEILSQFMRIVAQIFAESSIIEDMISVYLKEYFKNTAIKLIYSDKKPTALSIDNQKNSKGNIIFEHQKEIDSYNFVDKQKETFKISFLYRLKVLVLRLFNYNEKQTTPQQKIYQKMIQYTLDKIDIKEVYKDLIKLKMAVKLIMTKEQYAALQFCGCDLDFKSQPNMEQTQVKQKAISSHHKLDQVMPTQIMQQQSEENIIITMRQMSIQNQVIKQKDRDEKKNMKLNYQKMQSQSEAFNDKTTPSNQNKLKENNENKSKKVSKQNSLDIILTQGQNETLEDNNKIIQNHLQEIDQIISNQIELQNHLNKFIQKMNNKNTQKSHIDQNIYSSLIDYAEYQNNTV